MNLKFMKNKRERAEKVHIADMPRDDRRSPYMRMHFYPGMCAEVQGKFNVFFPGDLFICCSDRLHNMSMFDRCEKIKLSENRICVLWEIS